MRRRRILIGVACVVLCCALGAVFAQQKDEGKEKSKDGKDALNPGDKSYDEVYVTTAKTGDKIPHPLSKKTKRRIANGKKFDVPEGMVFVPEGEFLMGDEHHEHKVSLDSFCIGKYEVTNAEWKAFADATNFSPLPPGWKDGAIPEGKENQALVCVSWEDAQKYCEWVSKETGWTVTLPTEAQWEKAASWDSKKNQKFAYPWGNRWDEKLCNNGFWVEKRGLHWETNEQYEAFKKTPAGRQFVEAGGNTMAVGSFKGGQSPYGCHDMAGNAFEWCADWFTTEYHLLKDAKKNPQGPDEMAADELVSYGQRCKVRVMRGGSWRNTFRGCSTTHRDYLFPTARGYMFGFRIVVVSRVR